MSKFQVCVATAPTAPPVATNDICPSETWSAQPVRITTDNVINAKAATVAALYSCDGVSTERLVVEMAQRPGMAYMRTSRPKTPVIYGLDEKFPIGGSKVLRQSDTDVATVVGAGVTVFEALKAYDTLQAEGINIRIIDCYSLQPIDATTMVAAAKATGAMITVEDHYPAGGIGDAVSEAIALTGVGVRRLAVREIPRSGQPDELLDRYGISARHVVDAVRAATSK